MPETNVLPGFRGTRADVLLAVKKSQPVTAKELARELGLTTNALRRHLKELEADGLISFKKEIRGVGGPVFSYALTARGERLFPRTYEETLDQALELVSQGLGQRGLSQLFRLRWDAIAPETRASIASLPAGERAGRLAELLTSMGYMAESPGASVLRTHNCTVRAVAERFPEVCDAEHHFIQEMLGVPVARRAHIAKGATCCEYCVAPSPTAREVDAPSATPRPLSS
jgi:DeoR family suf operon transcriptional repressor